MKNSNGIGVIIIGDHVQGLGIIRSLGQFKIPIYLINDKSLCIGRYSKYLSKFIKMPSMNDESKFIHFLLNLAEQHKLNNYLLMPTNDIAVKIISQNKDVLKEYYRVPTPEWDITKFALDKKLTYCLATNNGIPTPKTIYFNKSFNFGEIDGIDIQYPVIVKGVEGLYFYKETGAKAFIANSDGEIKTILNNIFNSTDLSEIIIQEMISGDTSSMYSFCSFFKNGKVIRYWTGRKIREHPMGLGTATFAESVHVPEIIEFGSKLLEAMNYYGISEIEFKADPLDGKFKLIEMNARSWLWISLAKRAGIDFVAMLYNDTIGKNTTILDTEFKENVKWIHFYTDLWVSIKEMMGGKVSMRNYISSLRGEKEYAVFSLDDPLPFIAETLMLPYLWKNR